MWLNAALAAAPWMHRLTLPPEGKHPVPPPVVRQLPSRRADPHVALAMLNQDNPAMAAPRVWPVQVGSGEPALLLHHPPYFSANSSVTTVGEENSRVLVRRSACIVEIFGDQSDPRFRPGPPGIVAVLLVSNRQDFISSIAFASLFCSPIGLLVAWP